MKRWQLGIYFGSMALAVVGGCDCEEDVVSIPRPRCDLSADCGDVKAYKYGQCLPSSCDGDADCCPGTFCFPTTHTCLPNRLKLDNSCSRTQECVDRTGDPGRRCFDEPNGQGTCGYMACSDKGGCAEGLACFEGWCIARAPCAQGCPAGEVCEVGSGVCHPVASIKSCQQECPTGQLLVVDDPSVMVGEVCCPVACRCATLPPLGPGAYGRFASAAVAGHEVLVSAYNETYGDLVLARYAKNGELTELEHVDGVPAEGALGGDPNGPRGGIVTPGPDVGQYSSLVVTDRGEPRIAYYDAGQGDLRVAIYETAGERWVTHVVDHELDAGRYASMVIDPVTGRLRVAYLVMGPDARGQVVSRLRIATSRTPFPRTPGEWERVDVDTAPVPHPCGDRCRPLQTCVLNDWQPTCLQRTATCAPACNDGQACVDVGGSPTCLADLSAQGGGLLPARGLFADLTHTPDGDVLVYYDATAGDLRGVKISDRGPGSPAIVDGDGQGGRHAGDVGRFPAVAYDLSTRQLGIAYQDVSARALRFYRGADLQGGSFEVVETGYGAPPGARLVGADCDLVFTPDGQAHLIYQDATDVDLAYALRTLTGDWQTRRLLSDGAHGFDGSLALSDEAIYIASAVPHLAGDRRLASRLMLYVRPR